MKHSVAANLAILAGEDEARDKKYSPKPLSTKAAVMSNRQDYYLSCAALTPIDEPIYYTPRLFQTKANLVDYAKRELSLIGDGKDLMQAEMNNNVLNLIRQFADQGHSGGSVGYLTNVLQRLMAFKPLTPLTGEDDEWTDIAEQNGSTMFQNKRVPGVFKTDDKNAPYTLDGFVFREPATDGGYRPTFTSFFSRRNITFPYSVPDEPIYLDVVNNHPDDEPAQMLGDTCVNKPKKYLQARVDDYKRSFINARTKEKEGYPVPDSLLDAYFEVISDYEQMFHLEKSDVWAGKVRSSTMPWNLVVSGPGDSGKPTLSVNSNGEDNYVVKLKIADEGVNPFTRQVAFNPAQAAKDLMVAYKAWDQKQRVPEATASLQVTALKNDLDIGPFDKRTFILFKMTLQWLVNKYPWVGNPKITIVDMAEANRGRDPKKSPPYAYVRWPNYKTIYFIDHAVANLDKNNDFYKNTPNKKRSTLADSIRDNVIHEFAHLLIFKMLKWRDDAKFLKALRIVFPTLSGKKPSFLSFSQFKIPAGTSVSFYGTTNMHEYLAEAFNAAVMNKTRSSAYTLRIAKTLWQVLYSFAVKPKQDGKAAFKALRAVVKSKDADTVEPQVVKANLEVLADTPPYGWWITATGELVEVKDASHNKYALDYFIKLNPENKELRNPTSKALALGWIRLVNGDSFYTGKVLHVEIRKPVCAKAYNTLSKLLLKSNYVWDKFILVVYDPKTYDEASLNFENNKVLLNTMRKYVKYEIQSESVKSNLEVLARGAQASRIRQHIVDGSPFITISASRGELTPSENAKRTRALVGKLQKMPVSFIPVTGDFEETLADGTKKVATEHSFFVMPHSRPGEELSLKAFKQMGMYLCKHFDQQSIGFGDGKNISFIEQNGDTYHAGNALTFDNHKIASLPGFSRIGNKRFSFIEHDRVHPDDSMSDYGNHDWWQKLTRTERENYVKEHPKTELQVAAHMGGDRIATTLGKQAIPSQYKHLPIIGMGTTSIILDAGDGTVIMLTRDKMKQEWLSAGGLGGLEIGEYKGEFAASSRIPGVSEMPVFIIKMPKLFPLDSKNKRLVKEAIGEFNRTLQRSYITGNKEPLPATLKYFTGDGKEDHILNQVCAYLANYDTNQFRMDLDIRQFMQDKEGKIILVDPVVSEEIVQAVFRVKKRLSIASIPHEQPDLEANAAVSILNFVQQQMLAADNINPSAINDYHKEEPKPAKDVAIKSGRNLLDDDEEQAYTDSIRTTNTSPAPITILEEEGGNVLRKLKPHGSGKIVKDDTPFSPVQAKLEGVFDMREPAMREQYDNKIRGQIADYENTYADFAPNSKSAGFLTEEGLPRVDDAKYWTKQLETLGYTGVLVDDHGSVKLLDFAANKSPLSGKCKLSDYAEN